jgi:exodeoxyribonuclease VII large subunit
MNDERLGNSPALTVSQLSGDLKRAIEDRFGFVRVRGEVSGWRGPHASGHCYFSLKDASARIEAVIWKGVYGRMRVRPAEGLEVIASGKLTTFPNSSKYQIVVEAIEPAGLGALMALLEERRRKLAAEGLFEEARKQRLPYLPAVIGVVTSPTGAVIRDILHRLSERFPRRVLVWPVRVQGETSAAEVAAAIRGFDALAPGGAPPRPDVLSVARGGGSLEDLWSFNEEAVARAAAECRIPLISAIGHETDWTLLDHVADLRAPTPTGAAEKAVPVRADLLAQLGDLARRHAAAALRLVERGRRDLRAATRAMPTPDALVAGPRQRLDRAGERLGAGVARGVDARRLALSRLAHRLAAQSPGARLAHERARLSALDARLSRAVGLGGERRAARLAALSDRLRQGFAARLALARQQGTGQAQRLEQLGGRMLRALRQSHAARTARLTAVTQLFGSLGYKNVLARGFALVRDEAGQPIHAAAAVRPGQRLDIQFADGAVVAHEGASARPRPAVRPARDKPGQGDLF